MATFTNLSLAVAGNQPSAPIHAEEVQVTWTDNYTTGGDAFDPSAAIGAGKEILAIPDQIMSDGRVAHYDKATAKLQVFEGAVGPLTELANATDLSTVTAKLIILSQ